MLVLTRRVGEKIIIGNDITITVIKLSNGIVRLGFEAPKECSIYRKEIYDARQDDLNNQTPEDGSKNAE